MRKIAKLTLRKETVRGLESATLIQALGGLNQDSTHPTGNNTASSGGSYFCSTSAI